MLIFLDDGLVVDCELDPDAFELDGELVPEAELELDPEAELLLE